MFLALLALGSRGASFDFNTLREMAKTLARRPYQPSEFTLPPELAELGYIQHNQIQFKHERALWREERLPFQIEFFPPGWVLRDMVRIH